MHDFRTSLLSSNTFGGFFRWVVGRKDAATAKAISDKQPKHQTRAMVMKVDNHQVDEGTLVAMLNRRLEAAQVCL